MQPRRVALAFLLTVVSALVFSAAGAQQSAPKDSVPPPTKLRVFLDCNFCDVDFIHTEITFVDYVRDRQYSQVHILVTNQPTGGGGPSAARSKARRTSTISPSDT